MSDDLRVPPHSIPSEQSVLGGLMLDNEAWDRIADRVAEDDFYRRDHRLIFRAIADLAEHGKPLDAVTLGEWLENASQLDEAGGMGYLGELARNTPNAANITAYADIVRENSILRQLAQVGTDLVASSHNPSGRAVAEILDQAEGWVMSIGDRVSQQQTGPQAARTVIGRVIESLRARLEQGGGLNGMSSGFTDLDHMTDGLHPGELVIVAGRPAMGKTTFAMNIAEHAAVKNQTPVAVFSLEMPSEQLIERMLASQGGINFQRIRQADLDDDSPGSDKGGWAKITAATGIIADAPLFIDDSPALSPIDLRARARRLKREHGLGLIVVDYLQLMRSHGVENRNMEITRISQALKALAKELNLPVIALSQLNRGLEQRTNKRPAMSDLRESGAIEQDADTILFIYRDEVYNEDSPDKGTAEIIIGKQRNGPIGTVRLTFRGELLRFDGYACDIPEHGQDQKATSEN